MLPPFPVIPLEILTIRSSNELRRFLFGTQKTHRRNIMKTFDPRLVSVIPDALNGSKDVIINIDTREAESDESALTPSFLYVSRDTLGPSRCFGRGNARFPTKPSQSRVCWL